jgi:hypothetical protein
MLKELDIVLNKVYEPQSMTVVRLSTSVYSTNGKLVIKKELMPLKRKSYGYNHISDSISDCGAEETYRQIINISDADDGIYEVVVCNERRAWESGNVEEWDYRLVPYEE